MRPLKEEVEATHWLLVTDVKCDIEQSSKHIEVRTPLRVKNNLNIPLIAFLSSTLQLPDD